MICLPPNFQYKKWTSARVRTGPAAGENGGIMVHAPQTSLPRLLPMRVPRPKLAPAILRPARAPCRAQWLLSQAGVGWGLGGGLEKSAKMLKRKNSMVFVKQSQASIVMYINKLDMKIVHWSIWQLCCSQVCTPSPSQLSNQFFDVNSNTYFSIVQVHY